MDYTKINNTYITTAKSDVKDKIEVEIGDSKQVDFYPQMKIMRWDNEANFSARLIDDDISTPVISKPSEKILYAKNNLTINFYDITDGEGGYEFEIILKNKPKSNVITFSIETKGLDFFYQPELTKEEIDRGDQRPDNVVGSYAIYASENKVNYITGKEYKCGKVGHIFRPRIEDAKGGWVWGDLNINIETKTLTVTIPEDFLKKAKYPVKHAAGLTFGYNTAGASYAPLKDYLLVSNTKDTGAVGVLTTLSAYMWVSSLDKIKLAIYRNSDNVLIDYTGEISVDVVDNLTWKTANVINGATIAAVDYRLTSKVKDAACMVKNDAIANEGAFASNTYASAFPNPVTWSATIGRKCRYSIYATYSLIAAHIKSWDGLLYANTKSVNGLTIANVKSINKLE